VKSVVYLESEASSPLYRRALGITVSGLCGVWLGAGVDTCCVIPTRRCAPVWHDAGKLACSFECEALRWGNNVHVLPCEWSRTVAPCLSVFSTNYGLILISTSETELEISGHVMQRFWSKTIWKRPQNALRLLREQDEF